MLFCCGRSNTVSLCGASLRTDVNSKESLNLKGNQRCVLFVWSQDVDSAYLVKADLEDKVGALTDEINFLRNIYEEVVLFGTFGIISLNQLLFVFMNVSIVFILELLSM